MMIHVSKVHCKSAIRFGQALPGSGYLIMIKYLGSVLNRGRPFVLRSEKFLGS